MTADDHADHQSVIALPDAATYRRLHQPVQGRLNRVGVSVLFVKADGRVDWLGSASSELDQDRDHP